MPVRLSELRKSQRASRGITQASSRVVQSSESKKDDLREIIAGKCRVCGHEFKYLTTIHVEEYANGYEFHDLQVCPRCGTLYYTVFQVIYGEYTSRWKLLRRVEVGKMDLSLLDYPP